MVCFTSPNETWMRMIEKPNTARRLYMPLWDANGLMNAATRMGIDSVVTQAVIEDRMFHFGGVARECLELSDDYVKVRLKGVEGTIAGMDTLTELTRPFSWKVEALRITACAITYQFQITRGYTTPKSPPDWFPTVC
jgi:hypothetical protein